ncbi:MAG: hypothetical protein HY908_11965 [Myxococcales bacterium]|nr:hypothetical protein [Myxococcales bacterium]
MVDDSDEPGDGPRPEARPNRKAGRRPRAASGDRGPRAASAAAPRPQPEPAPEARRFTGAHLAAVLVVGVAAGAVGGYFTGKGSSGTAGKAEASGRPRQPAAAEGGAYVALGAWSPRLGPEHAKVTILEFSDFQ